MRLSKLELNGFKSFADDTALTFEPGVTAIVGPNGCGKSNVSDAVRWVLGEQRARMMRGAKMEEVIFQGSSARRPVNVAEVSLHFENEDGQLPIAFKEVVITRRLSRSGESEYLLNRAPCRLRDIMDLLRGTGLGTDAGVVIESKMIDALLSDRPDDRRELFEEAAGVGLYRDRRRSTERRLEETAADMQRLDDLINEVQTQVRSLARQRKRSERHAELMTRRFAVDLTLASREMAAWKDELESLDVRLVELREQAPGAQIAVSAAEVARDAAYAARAAADTERTERSRIASLAREAVLQLQSEVAVAEERQRNALTRRQRAEHDRAEGAALGARVTDEWEQAKAEETRCEEELRDAVERLRAAQAAEEQSRVSVATARGTVEQADRVAREHRDVVRRQELERDQADRERVELGQRRAQVASELEQLGDQLRLAEREQAEAQAIAEQAQQDQTQSQAGLDTARTAAREAHEREGIARADVRRVDEEYTALQGKHAALEGLERERVGLAPAAAKLLRDRDQFGEGAVLGPLTDFVGADSRAATLVERFLGANVHAVIVRDRAVAEAVRRWHAEHTPGALLLLPLDAISDGVDGGADELASLVRTDGPVRGWVRTLLGKVRSMDDGAAFVDGRGAIWLTGQTSSSGPLTRKAEIVTLREQIDSVDARRMAAQAFLGAAQADVASAEQALAAAQEQHTTTVRRAQEATHQLAERGNALQRAQRTLQEATALGERLAVRESEADQKMRAAVAAIAEQQEALVQADIAADATRQSLVSAERQQDEFRERRAAAQVAHAQSEARRQVAAEREERLGLESASAQARLEALLQEIAMIAQNDSELAQQMNIWQEELAARHATQSEADIALATAEGAVTAADQALAIAEHSLDAARHAATASADALHHAELRHTELAGRRTAIKERLEAEWRRPLDDLFNEYQPVEADVDALRAESEELRGQLDALGAVNPLAVEEHDEETKRLEFLQTQRQDLGDAQRQLQAAIKEIDVTARELFLKTFAEVREHFRSIFLTLFGGGECDLRLENPEAPLDCDIEIHASPRGKKTQRIHLLSSGERALVALSLLFGIFLTKPSPFCLLDEVDAPLDDANVGRFVKMLNQFKTNTQFIVITHNPRTTTEAADAVYGVTMQEPGVSSLVSVRMKGQPVDDEPVPAEAAAGA
ncbi:MAG: chromosome segregation protein SMC [Gemmatimonadaceae bacterium]|nr:chromosome segregation protein SMC [Gemmatimonadaceae bacterium]